MMPSMSYLVNKTSPDNICISHMHDPDLHEQQISRAQKGDLEAFNELIMFYQDSVYRQALWILNETEAAEDAAQEAFLLAYRKIHLFHGGPFRPWLMKITTNCCIDHIRAARRRPHQPLDFINADGEEIEPYWVKDPCDTPEKAFERSETCEDILRSIHRLPEEYRIAVILIDLQELDYSEAAEVLHIPLGTFKSRLSRARKLLREDLLRRKDKIVSFDFLDRVIR